MPTSAAGSSRHRRHHRGFTLLELLVVVAIMAIASAGVSFALRDPSEVQLDREAQRLAALLDAARARSRVNGVPVVWRTDAYGFRFEGLEANELPAKWLDPDTVAVGEPALLLGPDPIIGPQAVVLLSRSQPGRRLRVVTDGIHPFAVEPAFQ